MDKIKLPKVIIVVIIGLIVCNWFALMAAKLLYAKVQDTEQEVLRLQELVTELNTDMEAYRDNYTALWTTLNTYHGGSNE